MAASSYVSILGILIILFKTRRQPELPRLEEFLGPLNEGVWEVEIPKEEVTEPLGPEWKKSNINVPSPGTIASYRKGQYHIHETKDEWKVHLDRYDPDEHPILHLMDDAPLLLIIGDTFVTLVSGIRRNEKADTKTILETQEKQWHLQFIAGIILILIGIHISTDPMTAFSGIMGIILPTAIVIFGLLIIAEAFINIKKEPSSGKGIIYGLIVIIIGLLAYYMPAGSWAAILTVVLAAWMFASAIMLLKRVRKGRSAVPEGFASRLIIGLLSIFCVVGAYFMPISLLEFFMIIFGIIVILIGIMLSVNGLRLRGMMRSIHKTQENTN